MRATIQWILFYLGVSTVRCVQDLGHLCDGLLALDCSTQYIKGEDDEQVCGSDGKTYENFCYYSKARCMDHTMVMVSTGSCSGPTASTGTATMTVMTTDSITATTTTTAGPTTTTAATPDPLLVVFCQTKDTVTCQQQLDPICGSDGKFYLNQCEFSKAYCDDNSLLSKDISFCTGK